MTIHEAIKKMHDVLQSFYEEGELHAVAELIIEHLTGVSRSHRHQVKNTILNAENIQTLDLIIERLKNNEPIQYILNESWFSGLKFFVDKNVLIPRPETEELVEWVVSNCKFPIDTLRILDVGTGSGCIAISLRRRLGKSQVWACDVSAGAIAIAQLNAQRLGAQVNFLELNFLDEVARENLPIFDIIISNPPYIPEHGRAAMSTIVTEFEPSLALFVPDEDPFVFYRALGEFAKSHLQNNGSLYAEIHHSSGDAIKELIAPMGFEVEVRRDMSGHERFIRCTKKTC